MPFISHKMPFISQKMPFISYFYISISNNIQIFHKPPTKVQNTQPGTIKVKVTEKQILAELRVIWGGS
jgi:hypothetical protein